MPPVTPLKIAIVASGRTTRELAESIGRHETDLSRWANGRRTPSEDVKQLIADELGVPISDLFPALSEAA
jgi:transcriptional regulator with XRE-family HTH domain